MSTRPSGGAKRSRMSGAQPRRRSRSGPRVSGASSARGRRAAGVAERASEVARSKATEHKRRSQSSAPAQGVRQRLANAAERQSEVMRATRSSADGRGTGPRRQSSGGERSAPLCAGESAGGTRQRRTDKGRAGALITTKRGKT